MAGILPTGGAPAGETQNAIMNPSLVSECTANFYASRCNPRLDPFQANAVASELLNAINGGGVTYNCTELDNLQQALMNYSKLHVLSVAREVGGGNSYAVPQGTPGQRIPISNGAIDIPNSANYAIPASLTLALHSQVSVSSSGVRWTFGVWIYADAAMSQTITQCHFASLEDGSGTAKSIFDALSANVAFLEIPPGGRTLYYRFEGSANSAGVVNASETFARLMTYGAATPNGFTIDT